MAPCARKAQPASLAHVAASVETEVKAPRTGRATSNLAAPGRLPGAGGAVDRRLFVRRRGL
jgi:hypothetical protein